MISPAQAYHGPTMETLALTGRPGMHRPFEPYLPSTCTSRRAPGASIRPERPRSRRWTQALEEAGPGNVSAFFCEPISAAALPAYTPPARFWEGLAERRERHGFLVCFDEVVTGVGRTGRWFAGAATACVPDIIATAKGLGAGYAAIGAVLVREHVYEAFARGSRRFPLGHTWDGAPLACAVGLAVMDALRSERLIERVRDRGPRLRDELASASPTSRSSARCGATATCSECRTSIRATAIVPPAGAAGGGPDRRAPRSSTASSRSPRSRRATATRATRRCSLRRSPRPTTSSRRWSRGSPTPSTEVAEERGAGAAASEPLSSTPREVRDESARRTPARSAGPHPPARGTHPPGHVTEWLDAHGADVETLRIDIDDREVDPTEYDLIVSLGSEFAAFDDSKPFVPREAELMRRARRRATCPCSASASAARCWRGCSAARCSAATTSEIGWLPVRSARPGAGARGTVVPVALRRVHRAPGGDRDRRDRRRPAGVRRRTEPRSAVPSRGDDARSWTTGCACIATSSTPTVSIPMRCSRRRSGGRTESRARCRGSCWSAT